MDLVDESNSDWLRSLKKPVCSNTYADKLLSLINNGLCTSTSSLIITRNGTFIRTFKQVIVTYLIVTNSMKKW